ncbi:hypothetical protein HK102_007424 [Quaeritorhiza haematococci]|nr:hypothetical protein HK102_007424 [Quaeritorhiza haematococci]
MTLQKKEFALFPWRAWRVNPPFLEGQLPANLAHDPWARRDAWRNHPFFSRRNRLMNSVPGLGIATVAFAIFLTYDYWDRTAGPTAAKNEKWAAWMAEREKRLAAEGHHDGHH